MGLRCSFAALWRKAFDADDSLIPLGSMPLAVPLRIQMISGMHRLSITGGVCIQ